MNDIFKEQIIKRNPTSKDSLKKIGIVLAILVLNMAIMITPVGNFVFVTLGLSIFAAYHIMGFFNVEYEYVLTNGELDIDIIYNKARRKRLFSTQLGKVEVFAHYENANFTGQFNSAQDTKDFTSGNRGGNTYAFLIQLKTRKTQVLIEPDEKMLKALSGAIPRSKFHI